MGPTASSAIVSAEIAHRATRPPGSVRLYPPPPTSRAGPARRSRRRDRVSCRAPGIGRLESPPTPGGGVARTLPPRGIVEAATSQRAQLTAGSRSRHDERHALPKAACAAGCVAGGFALADLTLVTPLSLDGSVARSPNHCCGQVHAARAPSDRVNPVRRGLTRPGRIPPLGDGRLRDEAVGRRSMRPARGSEAQQLGQAGPCRTPRLCPVGRPALPNGDPLRCRGRADGGACCGSGISMRRSTIRTADRPGAGRPGLLHARCRQPGEHHLGIRPRALYSIGPPRQPQVDAASRLRSVSVGGGSPAVGGLGAPSGRHPSSADVPAHGAGPAAVEPSCGPSVRLRHYVTTNIAPGCMRCRAVFSA